MPGYYLAAHLRTTHFGAKAKGKEKGGEKRVSEEGHQENETIF